MKVELKELQGWKRSLDVEIPVEDVNRQMDTIVEEFRRRMSVPGFRKGKVPEKMARQSLGTTVDDEFLRRVVPEAYERAVRETAVVPAGQATIENLDYKPGQPLKFTALFEARPEIQPRDYRGLKLKQEIDEVTEEDVDKVLADLKERTAEFPVTEAPAGPGSIVMVDYEAHDENGKLMPEGRQHNYPVELGAEGLLPEFQTGLLGAKGGEGRTLTVNYPPEFRNQAMAGHSVRYDMKIREIREKKLPELDDNFAITHFGARDLQDLKSRIQLKMEGESRLAARERLEAAVVDGVIARNDFSPPESMVEELLNNVERRARDESKEITDDEVRQLREGYKTAAQRAVKRDLLWEAISRAESLKVEEAEVDSEIQRIVESARNRPQAEAPDERALRSPAGRSRIHDALADRRVYEFLTGSAEIEQSVRPRQSRIITP